MDQREGQTQDRHKTAHGSSRGIRFRAEARYHKKPWEMTLYHDGTKTRSFHETEEDARKAKSKAERLKAKEGSRALSYDRDAHTEYSAAKAIVGRNTPLVPLLRKLAAAHGLTTERKTVGAAVEHLLEAKEKQGVAHRTLKELRSRLRAFATSFPEREMESITRNEIVDWLNGLGLAGRTVWNFYALVGALFNYAERRDWIDKNPMRKIDPEADLPKVRKGKVAVLTVEQAAATMRHIEEHAPKLIGWACVQYFTGIRDAEAERLRGEWIDPKEKRIVLPGWHIEGAAAPEGITKTRDDWVMDHLPEAFWAWVARYPKAFGKGRLAYPSNRAWTKIRDDLIEKEVFAVWPANGFRHSFATYHLSAYRDVSATSLILRHQNADRLWNSYLAKLVPPEVGLKYLSLQPV
jgi:integrase